MNQTYHNDQAHIAEEFVMTDDHITQTAKLAFFKINSYKLSLVNAAFCMSRDELSGIIRNSLLTYIAAGSLLDEVDFFEQETDN